MDDSYMLLRNPKVLIITNVSFPFVYLVHRCKWKGAKFITISMRIYTNTRTAYIQNNLHYFPLPVFDIKIQIFL